MDQFAFERKDLFRLFSAVNFVIWIHCLWPYHSWYKHKILSHDWIIQIIEEVSILMFTVPKNHSASIINIYETFALSHPDTAITAHFKYLPLKQIKWFLK